MMRGAVVVVLVLALAIHCYGHTLLSSDKQVYVIYMGSKVHDDPKVTSMHNHQMLASVHEGSLDAARESIVYSYKHGFRGFSAKLTPEQAASFAKMPDVLSVFRSKAHHTHTTRSWEFLGMPGSELGGIPHSSASQYNVIVGILDTGIWPEAESFSDHSLPPVPKHWRGECMTGDNFTVSTCNRKLIGARFYKKGIEGETGPIKSINEGGENFLSPRDVEGHGTHTASTAAGRYLVNMSMEGLGNGWARGGAPLTRIAAYKVCWTLGCSDADLLAAFDDAIADGVDVLSLSLGPDPPQNDYFNDAVSIGSFHAVRKGISVVCSVGNNGPTTTATNVAPWIITVAASSIDRDFSSNVILGNNVSIKGESLSVERMNSSFVPLVFGGDANMPSFTSLQSSYCLNSSLDPKKVTGKLVVCRHPQDATDSKLAKSGVVKAAGGVGMILIDEADKSVGIRFVLPATLVGKRSGQLILSYINSTIAPTAHITPTSTIVDYKPAPQVASFSSRGPNQITPDILKPDITAPGLNILAAWSPAKMGIEYNIVSGTSMACPHVSGVAALLKASHPSWSPAAIKSAIMTTAYVKDNERLRISCSPTGVEANPFDFGAGHIYPKKSQNPGLVYDAGGQDYISFLCGSGYDKAALRLVTGDPRTSCPSNGTLAPNLNYPSITLARLVGTHRVMRTATNVGPATSTYRAVIKEPKGVKVRVIPEKLTFRSFEEKISFAIEFTVLTPAYDYVYGSLTWTDGRHKVRSPLAVNTWSWT